MPSIDNKTHTLLQGLSDFWTRFYADVDELNALYRGVEVLYGQAYLDLLSSFLNVSISETPLFNKELFKLVTFREDQVTFDAGINTSTDRHVVALPTDVVDVHILQNKVIDPTNILENGAGYEIGDGKFRFSTDPAGQAGVVIDTTTVGHLLAYGTSANLRRFYVTEGSPFAKAGVNSWWLKVANSGSGNDGTYKIVRVLDAQTVIIQPTAVTPVTTPELNDGHLSGTLIDANFTALNGFAHRVLTVITGGSFDDSVLRSTTEISSWYADSNVGLGVRKGDVLRILDNDVVPYIPLDLSIVLVRHDKLYFDVATPVTRKFTNIANYVFLREGPNPDVAEEIHSFSQTGVPKTGVAASILPGSSGTPVQPDDIILELTVHTLASTDRQRYVTLSGSGDITWTATIAPDGTLTRTAGMFYITARAFVGGTVTISGSSVTPTNNGTFDIADIVDANTLKITGMVFSAETTLSIHLDGVTNDGTYTNYKYLSNNQAVISPALSYPDPNNGSLSWTIHDGYKTTLAHTRIKRSTLSINAGIGDMYTGGHRLPVAGKEYKVNYETGIVTQIGRLAGTWSISPSLMVSSISYSYYLEVLATLTGSGVIEYEDVSVQVNEIAAWAPDVEVDKYNLYNNYGYLINRFEPSTESYREFIRGVFQLYILGPTLERIESALNVIAGFPVIRDDGEVLSGYDSTSDIDSNYVTTVRPNGDIATYAYPKSLCLRSDIQNATNVGTLAFESFEALSLAFHVSDYVQDPTWWDDMVIPQVLLRSESTPRRRTIGALIENIVGAWDDPRVGDLGLFVGADDEGNVPPFILDYPAKRRKMANVAMERFLKWNIFFAVFDSTFVNLFDDAFIDDLQDLILIAKPGYRYMYVEPYDTLLDTLLLKEDGIEIKASLSLGQETVALGEDVLTVQSFSWDIGMSWRYTPSVVGQALVVALGGSIPNSGAPISLGVTNIITKFLWKNSVEYTALQENIDYLFDYKAGTLTPLTIWPAGTYTIDLSHLILTPNSSADATQGDTVFVIGGQDPLRVRSRRNYAHGAVSQSSGFTHLVASSIAPFVALLHERTRIRIYTPHSLAGVYVIEQVRSSTDVLLADVVLAPSTDVVWSFLSEEPVDGTLRTVNAELTFESASALFRNSDVSRFVHVKDAVNTANNGWHQIEQILSPSQAVFVDRALLVAETDLHWRSEGTDQQMDMVERPLQITVH